MLSNMLVNGRNLKKKKREAGDGILPRKADARTLLLPLHANPADFNFSVFPRNKKTDAFSVIRLDMNTAQYLSQCSKGFD